MIRVGQLMDIQLNAHHEVVRTSTMAEALDYVAGRRGDSTALVEVEHLQRSLTWKEFRDQVERVRSGLEAAGLSAGEKVGVLLRNQLEFPVIWFAVTGCGAAIVPLNPKYTTREIDFVLSDAGATWAFGLGDLLEQHASECGLAGISSAHLISIGSSTHAALDYEAMLQSEVTPRKHDASPNEVVNIQFTSGTTGLPKGCLLTHQYWLELGAHGAAAFGDPQRFLADHPFYYMQNQAYFAMTLASGGAMYITSGLSRRKFLGWLYDHQIDFAWVDESMLELPASPRDSGLALKAAPVAGMPIDAYAPMEERFGIICRESYASTEIGSGIGVPLSRSDLAANGSMGLCLPNRQSKVINERLEDVPAGTPGELCMRGPGMMLGYHNRPDSNSELLLDGGWFRTGDVVIKTEDGLHYFQGRIKDIIRRSGENISALEVEMHLEKLNGVGEIAVIAVPDPIRDEEAKAIIVPSDTSLTKERVIEWARQGLADFKVPRYIEFRTELPYTGSGKVAKGKLKEEDPFHAGVTDTRS